MKLRLSSWAIANPLPVILFLLALMIGGLYSFHLLPVNGMPTVRTPAVSVSIPLAGASASDLEQQITLPTENALANISNIKHVTSFVENGLSVTQVEFRYGTNIQTALNTVREKIANIRPQLPTGIGEPVIEQSEDGNTPILTYAFQSSTTTLPTLTQQVDKELKTALMAIDGVQKVERQGGYEREIHIELQPEKLYALGVSAASVTRQIQAHIAQAPVGQLSLGNQETYLRIQGAPASVEALANMHITVGTEHSVKLSSLGILRDTFKQNQQRARLNNQPAIGIAIYRTAKGNELKIAEAIEQTIAQWQKRHPEVSTERVQSQVDFSRQTYVSANMAFLEGILLAALVVYAFLKSARATFIAAIAIPLSVIPTFIVMQWLGFSLNLVSMLGLSLVSGILVDDAIVEIENIIRHSQQGLNPYQASMQAADEIGLAVVATSFSIIAVFVPVSFMSGVVGQYFIQFGITVGTATFFSLIIARFVTPVMTAYFLKPIRPHQSTGKWRQWYTHWIQKLLHNRGIGMVLVGAILFASISLLLLLPTDFLPEEDKSFLMMQVELPAESRLKDTDETIQISSDALLKIADVKAVYAWIGAKDSDTGISGQVNRATFIIKLVDQAQRENSLAQLKTQAMHALQPIPNARFSVLNENGSKAFGLILTGNNPIQLYKSSMALENEMRTLPELSNVVSTAPSLKNSLVATPKAHEAARLGITSSDIAEELSVVLNNSSKNQHSHVFWQNQFIPISTFIAIPGESTLAFLQQLPITTAKQTLVPLVAVADIGLKADYSKITRYDRQPQVEINADLNGVSLGDALQNVYALPTVKNLPAGILLSETGDSEMLSEMIEAFSVSMLAGLMMVFITLILLFKKVLQPLTIMMALPLSIAGALLALIVTHQTISLPSIIGILMLMGIVGKNGILIVDFIIERRAAGVARNDAIIEACLQRSRPIIMTSIAMIAGMLPVILGAGAGTNFRTPMAYALIGGLITSTVLSLVVIPLIYIVMDDIEQFIKLKLSGIQ